MRAVILAALLSGFFVFGCASVPQPVPTKERPCMWCALSCPGGWMNKNAKVCRGSMWFRDITVSGEYTRRGVDGTVLTDVWTSDKGDFDKRDVVRMTCSSYIRQRVQSRDASERGQHPGEVEPWNLPKTP